ncbi:MULTISPECIES: ABC transporter permease [unclassified Modestobacter]
MTSDISVTPRRRPAAVLARLGASFSYGFGALIALVLAWEVVTTTWPSLFFPRPSVIWDNSMRLFFSGPADSLFLTDAVTIDVFGSLSRLLIGFALGSVVGVLVGTAIGRSVILRQLTDPTIEFLRSIPATATLPLFIILLGGDNGMRIAFIAYAVMWFVIINTASGVGSIHPTVLDMGRVFRIPRWKVLVRIIVPAALPEIFAGLRIGATVSLLAAVVSELVLASNGIGHRLIIAQTQFRIADLWSWIVLLAVLGFLLNITMELIERRLLAWDRLARVSN